MLLYLFRHGIAEDEGPEGDDASRRLTKEGVRRTRRVARGLARMIDPPEVILTSPLVRAVQTAEILAEVFGGDTETLDVLGGGSAQRIIGALRKRKEASILAVGHEPTLSRIVETLCAKGVDRGFIEMKKAGCAALELDSPGPARLLWLATPKLLAAK